MAPADSSAPEHPFDPSAKAVVFDFFGTLAHGHGELDVCAAAHAVLNGHRRPDRPEILHMSIWPVYDRYKLLDYCGKVTPRILWENVLQYVLDHNGFSFDQLFKEGVTPHQVVIDLMRAEEELYKSVILDPQAAKLVELAGDRGLRRVLCSNATALGWATIRRLLSWGQLVTLFGNSGNLAVSSLVGHHKQSDALSLFEWIIRAINLDPATTVVVEDEYRYVELAKKLGFRTVLVSPLPPTECHKADLVVANLEELILLVERLPA